MMIEWRNDPPRPGEWEAPDIIGWAFRGTFWPHDQWDVHQRVEAAKPDDYMRRPEKTTDHGVILELAVEGADGLPLWARWRHHLFNFGNLRGQWCPIRVPQ